MSLLNFKNSSNYGIYATSTSIGNRGNTVDFFARDYNLTGGVNITTRSILSLNPDGKVGIGTLNISGLATLNNSVTCISSLNVSGITTFSNKVGINTTATNCNLEILGVANIHNGTRYAALYQNLNQGSLIIGSTGLNYGGGTNWNGGNAAGLMMECDNNTEIVVHDNANRLAYLMYYEGGATNKLTLGRNMGWDTLSSIVMNGNVSCTGSLGVSTNITCNAITCSSTGNALYVSGGGASIFSGKVGILNAFPQAYLHLGNVEVVGSNPAIIFGKYTYWWRG